LVKTLLDDPCRAPWNAVCRHYRKCAGDYATDNERWEIVQYLVDWATRSELILGTIHKQARVFNDIEPDRQKNEGGNYNNIPIPLEEQSSTKVDYLQQKVTYNSDNTALIDEDKDAVMMEWERPIMKAHAQILLEDCIVKDNPSANKSRRVLNIGFGLGIIDTILQEEWKPTIHYIVEAHPDVYRKMIHDGWDQKPGVTICFGRWQDILPRLLLAHAGMNNNLEFDGIFFDTYAEHSYDMEDFHKLITTTATTSCSDGSSSTCTRTPLLAKPFGIYSFFNGLAPDNLFFHGVACNVVKLQLGTLGLDTEFLQCQITAPANSVHDVISSKTWEGIRRKYWHGRDVYYLPKVTWNQEFIGRKTKNRNINDNDNDDIHNNKNDDDDMMMDIDNDNHKRQRR